ncbi:UNVERIFIED_CONTAM: hypothetical protein Sradi_3289500 [Sesamum radiatum]|uniref:Uncharacterized protein n=1 Tax=Sesamum radiatum TaxID=300843 RepID=A0AAW2R0U8_SESRA
MSFLKHNLKDWCYQASIQKNMKRLRGKIKQTPLCCDNNDFSIIIGESSEPRKRKKQKVTHILGVPKEPLSDKDPAGPKQRPDHTNLGKGPDQQGFHPKDLDEQMQDIQDEPLQEEFLDEPIPEPMKVLKTATTGPAYQRVTYLLTACRNVVKYANLKPRMIS